MELLTILCLSWLYCKSILYNFKLDILIIFLYLTGIAQGQGQECTRLMDQSLVTYRAQNIRTGAVGSYLTSTLRVLQEYQFNCSSTNITSLILGIDARAGYTLFPSVQVFRPSGDQYDLVTGSERTIYYSTSNVSTSGVFEYPLNPPIPVISGDLLAVSQPEQGHSVVRFYYISGVSFDSSQHAFGTRNNIDLSNTSITNQLFLVYPVTGKTHTYP